MLEVPLPARWANFDQYQRLYVQCPSYWLESDCDSYNTHTFLKPLALQQAFLLNPNKAWYVLADDDVFFNQQSLQARLARLSVKKPLCVGHLFGVGGDLRGSFAGVESQPAFLYIGGGSGFACNNKAMRRLYRFLDKGAVKNPRSRYLAFQSDVAIGKCMADLGIPREHLKDYHVSDLAELKNVAIDVLSGRRPWPATVHKVRTEEDFRIAYAMMTVHGFLNASSRRAVGRSMRHVKKEI